MSGDEIPFRWIKVKDRDELEQLYLSLLPKLRAAAREFGYAIGLHGSARRDLDLIAAPWRDGASSPDELARAIHRAACGIVSESYQWESKPCGRVATVFPICWPEFGEGIPSLGHIDLSITK
jgi:hypothetical protein